jgi:hypothetical protein
MYAVDNRPQLPGQTLLVIRDCTSEASNGCEEAVSLLLGVSVILPGFSQSPPKQSVNSMCMIAYATISHHFLSRYKPRRVHGTEVFPDGIPNPATTSHNTSPPPKACSSEKWGNFETLRPQSRGSILKYKQSIHWNLSRCVFQMQLALFKTYSWAVFVHLCFPKPCIAQPNHLANKHNQWKSCLKEGLVCTRTGLT